MSGIRIAAAVVILCAPMRAQSRAGYAEAAALVRQEKSGLAVPLLEKVVAGAPRDLKAGNLLGIALLNTGRKDEAAARFRKVLAVDANFAPAVKNLGVAEFARGDPDAAKRQFDHLLRLAPGDAVAHLYLGEIAFGKQHYREAAAHYERSGGLHLQQPAFALHFAKASVELRNTAAAEQALAGIPESAPADHQFQAGVLLAAIEKYAEAARRFRISQRTSTEPYEAGFNVVLSSLRAGDSAGAIQAGEQLIAQGHRKAELYNLLARAYDESGRTQQAYDTLRTATAIAPSDENNYLDLMAIALRHENLSLSLEIADVALERLPQSYGVRLQRGAVLALMGRPSDAEAALLDAARIAPENNLGYVALAMVRVQSGKVAEAVETLRTRRAKSPRDYLVNLYLGEALIRLGEHQEAAAVLEAAVSANSRAAPPRALLGKLLAGQGELKRAAAEFEEALKLDPADLAPAYQLAGVHRKLGNTRRADELLDLYEKAKTPGEGDSAARELLKVLQGSR